MFLMFSFSVTFSFAGVTGMKDTNNFRTFSIVFNITVKKKNHWLGWRYPVVVKLGYPGLNPQHCKGKALREAQLASQ